MIWRILFMICLHETFLSAYNIEDGLPLYKVGDQGSNFGFSVALHKSSNQTQRSGSVTTSMLLIGSPTAERREDQPNTKRPGALYSCPVSTSTRDCNRVLIDSGPSTREGNKTDQWLGVNIKSKGPGQEFITCAHRFSASKGSNSYEEQQVCGKCFLLKATSSNEIVDLSDQVGGRFLASPCSNRNKLFYKKNGFAYTQAGTSIDFADGDYLLGGPGTYSWSGGVYGYPLPEEVEDEFNQPLLTGNEKMFGSLGCTDTEFKSSTTGIKCQNIPLQRDSYIGFSLATSYSMSYSGEPTYIAGAPRGNFTGAIIMYKKTMKDGENPRFVVVQNDIIFGEHVGSSFGYSVITININSDKLDDLVVGSPQYYEREGDTEYGGAIYVYINDRKKNFRDNKVQKIRGKPGSFFGHSLVRLGDIDQDGYDDFAVGAPFENDGKVYIYRGSANGEVELSQVLNGQKFTRITSNMRGFGISMSGEVDIDNNGYPDLMVGTLKDQAILFRSRPIISVRPSLELSKDEIDLKKPSCRLYTKDYSCFHLQVCFEYRELEGISESVFSGPLPLKYTLSLDSSKPKNRENARARFSSPSGESFIAKNYTIPDSGARFCLENHTVYYRPNSRDRLSPIDIYFDFSLISDNKKIVSEEEGDPLFRMLDDPILDRKYPNKMVKKVKIKTHCGDDGCQSAMKLSGYVPPKLVVGTKNITVMTINISNPGEDAHQAGVTVELPHYVFVTNYSYTKPSNTTIKCSSSSGRKSSTYVKCELGNPYPAKSHDQITLFLDVSSLTADEPEGEFVIQGSTASDNANNLSLTLKSKIVGEMELFLTGYGKPQQVRYKNALILGESAINYIGEIGPLITQTFIVENKGKLIANKILLNIQYPIEIKNGKWLLYLVQTKVTAGAGVAAGQCLDKDIANPLKYQLRSPLPNRRKREIGEEGQTAPLYSPDNTFQSGSLTSSLNLECTDESARCITLQCQISPLKSGRSVSITLVSRLWNATFLEEFKNIDLVYVNVNAKLSYNQSNIRIIGNQTTKNIQTTVDHDFFKEDIGSTITWWFILIGVIIALIIYALIIYLLIHCGFFKRNRRKRTLVDPPSEKEALVEERRRHAEERM